MGLLFLDGVRLESTGNFLIDGALGMLSQFVLILPIFYVVQYYLVIEAGAKGQFWFPGVAYGLGLNALIFLALLLTGRARKHGFLTSYFALGTLGFAFFMFLPEFAVKRIYF